MAPKRKGTATAAAKKKKQRTETAILKSACDAKADTTLNSAYKIMAMRIWDALVTPESSALGPRELYLLVVDYLIDATDREWRLSFHVFGKSWNMVPALTVKTKRLVNVIVGMRHEFDNALRVPDCDYCYKPGHSCAAHGQKRLITYQPLSRIPQMNITPDKLMEGTKTTVEEKIVFRVNHHWCFSGHLKDPESDMTHMSFPSSNLLTDPVRTWQQIHIQAIQSDTEKHGIRFTEQSHTVLEYAHKDIPGIDD